jgi:hypothetical protein
VPCCTLVFELCSCDFSMRLERRDQNHLAEAVTQCEVARVAYASQETSDTQEKNNQLASGNTRASKACSTFTGLTGRLRTIWPCHTVSSIAEAQP